MWFLQNTVNASLRFSLQAGKDLIIGRKNCDLQIEGDQSISRKHATLHVAGTEKGSKVTLTDNGSKFGSFVDGRRLSANQKVELSIGSELKFGQGPTTGTFKLVYEPLVFCCSSMGGQEKQRVKQLAKTLRGRVVNSWSSECTHLVMTNLNVTIKVVSALSSCRPIITPDWLEAASQCFSEGKPLPNPAHYQPAVSDTNLEEEEVSFRPDFSRRTLFQDRAIYFLCSKQLSNLRQCVESAGARCVDCSGPCSVELDTLTAKESVVLNLDQDALEQLPQEQQEWVEQVNNFLDSHDLRTVHDCEIGFALLYISIEKHCNPRTREGVPEVASPLPAPTLSQAPLTQFTEHDQPPHPHVIPSQPSSTITSILAPDSMVSSQGSAHISQSSAQSMPKHLKRGMSEEGSSGSSSAASDVTTKVNETIIHRAKSSHQDACEGQSGTLPAKRKRGPASNDGSGGPKLKQPKLLDCLFDGELSPIQMKDVSKRGDSHSGPVTSTQAPRSTKGLENLSTKPADDSQPDSKRADSLNSSKLPGLKTVMSHGDTSVSSNLVIGTKGQGQSLAKNSAEPHAMESSQDASVLVPSSLTPSSQQKRGPGDTSQLPNSGLLSELFQSSMRKKKNIKRGANVLGDNEDDDVVCIDDEERGRGKEGEGGEGEPAAKKKRIEPASSMGATAGSEKGQSGAAGGCGLFGGLQSRRKTNKAEKSKISNGVRVSGEDSGDKETHNAGTDTTAVSTKLADRSDDKLSYRDQFSRPLDPVEQVPSQAASADTCSGEHKDRADKEHKTPKKTPKKSPTTFMSTSPFLSTRKQKRKKSPSLEDDSRPGEAKQSSEHGSDGVPNSAVKSLFLDTPSTEHTATGTGTLSTQTGTGSTAGGGASAKQKRFLTTPFTFLTTGTSRKPSESVAENTAITAGAASVGMRSKTATPFTVGRRSKVRTAADELWEEGEEEGGGATGGEGRGFDGENPLGTQVDEEVSSQGGVFKPVYAEDGFIVARREPARQVSRLGRFALRTKKELFTSPDSSGGAMGVVNPSQQEVLVEIVRTPLIFRAAGEIIRRKNGDNGMMSNGLKNFKKFNKTLNTSSSAGIPRFVDLMTYHPKDDLSLPDWPVSESTGPEVPAPSMHSEGDGKEPDHEEEEEEEEENDDDDLFGFARPVVINKRRRR